MWKGYNLSLDAQFAFQYPHTRWEFLLLVCVALTVFSDTVCFAILSVISLKTWVWAVDRTHSGLARSCAKFTNATFTTVNKFCTFKNDHFTLF